ncbi:beta-ketoacyl-ACP synthase III [Desulfovibrio psychrotolerans]|uniref:Beta-ketoacyl-[acyl-carrier-protein] synthase III n=1 Tax=Desulfovibrio psychrotolerans TaxID=415242 RepID=A0A7J0BUK8_9BACT|nr:beta-ketoacyl-ACP synthase III [Desulfovibrio psychrotolerans]GFM37396.1 3-oxoacyl-[acyl-carrier-protein] synthase 3 [Desulfovibrio psychrotolerans]
MTKPCYIRGFGSFAPAKLLTNRDLEKIVDTSDEWIISRTGIEQRHVVVEGQCTSDLVAEAARAALADAGMQAQNLSHIIVATCTPDAYCPNTACVVEDKLGVKGLMALDISAACSGFVYGLDVARAMVCCKPDAVVLLSGGETMTSRVNWEDRNTCVLFGDGAGAVVITSEPGPDSAQIVDIELSSDGSLRDLLTITGGGSSMPYTLNQPVPAEHFILMQGREVFKHAVRSMTGVCETVLQRNGLTTADVDLLIPHQANMRIVEAVGKKLELPAENVFVNLHKYGNTSAASIPLALADARAQGRIRPGMNVLLTTFGGGFTWGSALLKF